MALIVALFGLFVAVLGVAGLVSPAKLLDLVTRVQTRAGLWTIASLRLLIGAALLLVAAESRAPFYLQILGCVAILSGIATPFFGVRRFEAIVAWWRGLPPWVVRIWSGLVGIFGLSMVWAVL